MATKCRTMECPARSSSLPGVHQHGIRVDVCACGGVWLTAVDMQRIRRLPPPADSGTTAGAIAYGVSEGLVELPLGVLTGL